MPCSEFPIMTAPVTITFLVFSEQWREYSLIPSVSLDGNTKISICESTPEDLQKCGLRFGVIIIKDFSGIVHYFLKCLIKILKAYEFICSLWNNSCPSPPISFLCPSMWILRTSVGAPPSLLHMVWRCI